MFFQQTTSTALKALNLASIGLAMIRIFADDTATVTGITLTITANLTQLYASSSLTTPIAGFTNCVSAINLLYQPDSAVRTFNLALQTTNIAANTLFCKNKKYNQRRREIALPEERARLLNGL